MSLSKKRNAERMKKARAAQKAQGAILLPKSLVRRLRGLGIDPERYLDLPSVSLDAYRDLQRQLSARTQRVEWQSGGIAMLRQEIATLQARLATLPAMQDAATLQRIMALETDQALHQATAHPSAEGQDDETRASATPQSGAKA